MSSIPVDRSRNGGFKIPEALARVAEVEEFDFSKPLDRPRPLTLNIDRQRSYDERSLFELSVGISPCQMGQKVDSSTRLGDLLDHVHSPLPKSGLNTPRSVTLDPSPLTSEAWEALRRSLVYFRGQPVGTIAALDNSDEKLNYDQVA